MLLDIGLPRMSGFDVCKAIRGEPWGRDINIIAMTGWGQEEDRKRTAEVGFNHHLVKPIDHNILMDLIDEDSLNGSGKKATPDLQGA